MRDLNSFKVLGTLVHLKLYTEVPISTYGTVVLKEMCA